MIVREGEIVEKILLTPKGYRISVKRSKLQLRLRSMPTINVAFKARRLKGSKGISEEG